MMMAPMAHPDQNRGASFGHFPDDRGSASEEAGTDPRRDPGSGLTLLLAWVATAIVVTGVVFMQAQGRNAPLPAIATTTEVEPPDALINLIGRYTVGASHFAGAAAASGSAPSPGSGADMMQAMEGFGGDPSDALRIAIASAEIEGTPKALERLDAIEKRDPLPDQLREDIASLRRIYTGEGEALTPEKSAALAERHGWFGRLALTFGRPDTDAARASALGAANRTTMVLLGASIGAVGVGLIGVALGIVALVLLVQRKIRPAYAPPAPGGSVYLEAFAVFLLGFVGVSALAGLIEQATGADTTIYLIWVLLLCPFYPLLRGAVWRKHRYALGFHAGAPLRGRDVGQDRFVRVAREMGAGVLGYLAGMPIFLAGVCLTLLVALVMGALAGPGGEGAPPNAHPIIREVGAGGLAGAVKLLLLASVWAPIVEELMFRGCFYHHLRGRARPIVAATLVAFVFAVIHPPGIVAVPALMSLAIVFALIREWRGSVIGCMTAHALHNGALMTTLMLALA